MNYCTRVREDVLMDYEQFQALLQDRVKEARIKLAQEEHDLGLLMILLHRKNRGQDVEEKILSLMEKYLYHIRIGQLDLPLRVVNPLLEAGFSTVGDVLADELAERLLNSRNFGPRALQVLARNLEEKGYRIPKGWKRYLPQG